MTDLKSIKIDKKDTLIVALKKMDSSDGKLLLVMDEDDFYSLLSIGDIQRAILKGVSLDTSVSDVVRSSITVADSSWSEAQIKDFMFHRRVECMPVIHERKVIKIYFWNDFFGDDALLQEALRDVPVVVMAGGKGSRLKPLTDVIPKALLPVGGATMLERIVRNFIKEGGRTFYYSLNYKSKMIKEYVVENLFDEKTSHSFCVEDIPLGTMGSLTLLREKLSSTFFVTNCDILLKQSFSEVLKYHREKKNMITIIGALQHFSLPYGVMETGYDGKLKEMKEKPNFSFQINTGVYILEPEVLSLIPRNTAFGANQLIEKVCEKGGKVGVFPISEGAWVDIGVWKEYSKELVKYFD